MTDAKTLAYINMYAVLGTLENLCALDENARAILTNKKPITVGLFVKDGPNATITFKNGRCRMEGGIGPCDIKLPFSSCEKFNGLIDGTVTPIPTKGLQHIGFLLKCFVPLTDLLAKYMRPDPADLEDENFFNISTSLMLYTISVAISQIGNNDEIGKFSAHLIPDGDIQLSIAGGPGATIRVKNHHLVTIKKLPESPRALMEFSSMKLARELFDGKVNAVACIGAGTIKMGGMINMVDNVNRILDRVALYLA
ncbi:MAG: hypothetical protein PUG93_09225 [Oscillospiraceae bacterium]|nr:hypothetical protein [Oscillospiraceae bacterium]MDD7355294.1 hypothetical protein [Oscillospiraceae bacterium]MDY3937024.1 hypothetical protein [Oscillospiraceae bacterium]